MRILVPLCKRITAGRQRGRGGGMRGARSCNATSHDAWQVSSTISRRTGACIGCAPSITRWGDSAAGMVAMSLTAFQVAAGVGLSAAPGRLGCARRGAGALRVARAPRARVVVAKAGEYWPGEWLCVRVRMCVEARKLELTRWASRSIADTCTNRRGKSGLRTSRAPLSVRNATRRSVDSRRRRAISCKRRREPRIRRLSCSPSPASLASCCSASGQAPSYEHTRIAAADEVGVGTVSSYSDLHGSCADSASSGRCNESAMLADCERPCNSIATSA